MICCRALGAVREYEIPGVSSMADFDLIVRGGRVYDGSGSESFEADVAIKDGVIVAKEIEMRGSFRFHDEFALAVDLINNRRVDVKPLLTGIYPMDEAVAAFEIAGDRTQSMKVQIAFA